MNATLTIHEYEYRINGGEWKRNLVSYLMVNYCNWAFRNQNVIMCTMNICISTYASDNNRHIVHVCDTGTHDLHALYIWWTYSIFQNKNERKKINESLLSVEQFFVIFQFSFNNIQTTTAEKRIERMCYHIICFIRIHHFHF